MSDEASVAAAMAKPIPQLREAGPLTGERHSVGVKGKDVTSAGARRCRCRASERGSAGLLNNLCLPPPALLMMVSLSAVLLLQGLELHPV